MKKCTQCKEEKFLSEFSLSKYSKSGVSSQCKICDRKRVREYSHTKLGLITRIFANQRQNSKVRQHPPPIYSKQELKQWLFLQPLFHELFDNWKASEFDRMLAPSCDRIDDDLGYSLDRLQLMTFEDNSNKAKEDIKSGKLLQKTMRDIVSINIITGEELNYKSLRIAQAKTGVDYRNIHACCKGKKWHKSAGGYKWKYKNK